MATSSNLNVSCGSALLGLPSGRSKDRSLAAAYAEGHEFNLTQPGQPERLTGTLVSAEFFNTPTRRAMWVDPLVALR